ncbi:MAG: sulfotransferase domain-containing protein [Pseudomonadota bacterium]
MHVIWLASYPKSGNTFLRLLLHSYFFGNNQDSSTIAKNMPDIHRLLETKRELAPNVQHLVKTHFLYSLQHPYAANTIGFIYVLRNPRDVLLSNARFMLDEQTADQLAEYARTFIKNMGEPLWEKHNNMGTWPTHVGSWVIASTRHPHIFVKYEDLRQDTANILRRVLRFLGNEPDETKVKAAVAACEIDAVRKKEMAERKRAGGEASEVFHTRSGDAFVGQGKMGQSLAHLGADIEELYQKRFGEIAHLFGYQ